MIMPFTNDELCIVSMYDSGNRTDTINAIADAVKHFDEAEPELLHIVSSAFDKLNNISEEEYLELDLDPDHLL